MPFPWQFPKMQDSNTPTNPKSSKNPFFSVVPNPMTTILSNPGPASFKSQLELAFQNLNIQAWRTLQLGFSNFFFPPNGFQFLAQIPAGVGVGPRRRTMPIKTIEERLSGVPVYALSNAAEEFVLVSGLRTGKSIGLICFKRENAETLLHQMKSMNHEMQEGSKVVAIALNKAFQLKVNGVAFRLIPDPEQVLNAVKADADAGARCRRRRSAQTQAQTLGSDASAQFRRRHSAQTQAQTLGSTSSAARDVRSRFGVSSSSSCPTVLGDAYTQVGVTPSWPLNYLQ